MIDGTWGCSEVEIVKYCGSWMASVKDIDDRVEIAAGKTKKAARHAAIRELQRLIKVLETEEK